MSTGFLSARAYIRSHMEALEYEEHRDYFDEENVPETELPDSYMMISSLISNIGDEQPDLKENEFTIIIRFWSDEVKDPTTAVEDLHERAFSILQRIQEPRNMQSANIKNAKYSTIEFDPLSLSQGNVAKCEITVLVEKDLCFQDPTL